MIHAKRVYIKASAKGMDRLYDTGGKLCLIHRLRNNKIAEITRLQSKCKKNRNDGGDCSRQSSTYYSNQPSS